MPDAHRTFLLGPSQAPLGSSTYFAKAVRAELGAVELRQARADNSQQTQTTRTRPVGCLERAAGTRLRTPHSHRALDANPPQESPPRQREPAHHLTHPSAHREHTSTTCWHTAGPGRALDARSRPKAPPSCGGTLPPAGVGPYPGQPRNPGVADSSQAPLGFIANGPSTASSPTPSQLHRRPPHGSVAGAVRNSTAAHHPAHAISCSPRSPRRGLLAREGSSVTSSPRACAPRQAPPRRIVPASSHRCRRSPPARCRRSAWLPRSPSTSHR